ncbi:tRNA lysidine(34) synthetase TilS [Patiriisocius hiemis]|uniref:tRNA(Ile)-lysidine synthase n=1 Tax=Patiriisocius hiemis TaxID=3075604 RepID=A0ABU2YAI9_9FLAO|nr:tRNA lysidine(34) synthetase TilS [Constantimarinum sp. W242]MDT0555027.1 tRNA lysidine(34) synthetase TilS [Constantimarinum sp. W242]
MLAALKKHIETQFPSLKNSKLLLACSGGVDSMVLLYFLHKLNIKTAVAHCNFSLRGEESDEDEAFVKEMSSNYNLVFYSERFNTKKYASEKGISTQMAARELRYNWFFHLLEEHGYDFVVTAHHADDTLETFLINLSRGTGIKGLLGIPEKTETVIRPLLPFSRKEIEGVAKAQSLYWREDSSNASKDYLRNKLRHTVIPGFKSAAPKILDSLKQTQQNLGEVSNLLDDYMTLVYNLVISEIEDGYKIDIEKTKSLPNSKALLFQLLSPFGFTDFDSILDLMDSQSGKSVYSNSHRLLKDREFLLLSENQEVDFKTVIIDKETSEITVPIHLTFSEADTYKITNAHTVFIDASTLEFPLELRKWKEGDTFQPFGMKGKKKLSKFFKDEKLSLIAKEKTFVLISNNDIVWVVGHRLDEKFKVTQKTKNILKIVYTPA